jgi:hypothetical protein
MAQTATIAKHDKRKRLVLPDDFVAEAPYGKYIIREGKLREAVGAKEEDCPPDFFTEPLDD